MSVALDLATMSPTEVQDYLVRLAMEAYDRTYADRHEGGPGIQQIRSERRRAFEREVRERMAQAAGAVVLTIASLTPDEPEADDEPGDIDGDDAGALASAGLGTDEDYA